MCYICGKSDNKIAHSWDCRYVKLIPEKNRKYFDYRRSANEAGFGYCKYCSYVMRYVRKEKKALDDYCQATGLTYSFNRQVGSLDIKSRSDEWKIRMIQRQRRKDNRYRLQIPAVTEMWCDSIAI